MTIVWYTLESLVPVRRSGGKNRKHRVKFVKKYTRVSRLEYTEGE